MFWRCNCALVVLSAAMAGCQSYAPQPLDLSAHGRQMESREVGGEAIADFSRRLAGATTRPAYDPGDGISLAEGEVLALFYNPRLRSARAKARVPLLSARESGRWEDPELSVDVERILNSVERPWVLGGLLTFSIPISGRLGAERDLAFSQADTELAQALLAEHELLVELREKWLEWSAGRRRAELLKQFTANLSSVAERARGLSQAGELEAMDARLFQIERLSRQSELRVLEIDLQRQEAELRALMGLSPQARLALTPTLGVALQEAASGAEPGELVQAHPQVRVARAEYEQAEKRLRLEVRKQIGDVEIGAGPGSEEGDKRLLLGLALPLPLLNANRQAIAEARAQRDAARVQAEAVYEQLVRQAAQERLALQAARVARAEIEKELAPLVDRQVDDLMKLGKLGESATLMSLEAMRQSFETKVQVLEAVHKEAAAIVRLNALLGPPLKGRAATEVAP